MFLDSTLRTLKAKLEGAHTTTAPVCTTGFADISAGATVFAPGQEVDTFNGSAVITILSAPANNVQRQVKSINIYNADTVQHTVTILYYDDATPYTVIAIAVPAGKTLLWTYENGWVIQGGVAGGVTEFTGLTDVPGTYVGQGGKLVRVNVGESVLEFIDASTVVPDTFLELTDTPSTYVGQGDKLVTVNPGGTALEFIDASTVVPDTFLELTDTPSSYVGQGGLSVRVNAGATALEFYTPDPGVDTFLELTDTPSSYAGQGDKLVAVNPGGTALEFITAPDTGVDTFLELTDTPGSYAGQALNAVRVNTGATALEFYTPDPGVDTFLELTDTPSSYVGQGDKLVAVNPGGTALEFITAPATGVDTFLELTDTPGTYAGQGGKLVRVNVAENALEFLAGGGGGRPTLIADTTFYVRTDGSDGNDGSANTAGSAWLTLQHAIDVLLTYDLGGFTATIQVGTGTYAAGVLLTKSFTGGSVVLQGNTTTPSLVTISTTDDCIRLENKSVLDIRGFKLVSSAGTGIHTLTDAVANVTGAVEFGACSVAHMRAEQASAITVTANYAISGSAARHVLCVQNSVVVVTGLTVTISGTPNFSVAFVAAFRGAVVDTQTNTYSGSATGTRYNVNTNGVCFVNGAGTAYLPGNAAGVVATGGVYA